MAHLTAIFLSFLAVGILELQSGCGFSIVPGNSKSLAQGNYVQSEGSSYGALTSRIVGGQETSVLEFPSIVQVESVVSYTWTQNCAATILNSLYVLSAARCFSGSLYTPDRRRIRAGATYRQVGGEVFGVETEFIHPSYVTGEADIVVVRLTNNFEWNLEIQMGWLISQNSVIPDNLPVVYAGWGVTEEAISSDVLRKANVYTVNNELCRERYAEIGQVVTKNMICAGVGGRDACNNDVGGPLYWDEAIIGVISWGEGCGNGTFPGVNTAVGSYTNWIVSVAV